MKCTVCDELISEWVTISYRYGILEIICESCYKSEV